MNQLTINAGLSLAYDWLNEVPDAVIEVSNTWRQLLPVNKVYEYARKHEYLHNANDMRKFLNELALDIDTRKQADEVLALVDPTNKRSVRYVMAKLFKDRHRQVLNVLSVITSPKTLRREGYTTTEALRAKLQEVVKGFNEWLNYSIFTEKLIANELVKYVERKLQDEYVYALEGWQDVDDVLWNIRTGFDSWSGYVAGACKIISTLPVDINGATMYKLYADYKAHYHQPIDPLGGVFLRDPLMAVVDQVNSRVLADRELVQNIRHVLTQSDSMGRVDEANLREALSLVLEKYKQIEKSA